MWCAVLILVSVKYSPLRNVCCWNAPVLCTFCGKIRNTFHFFLMECIYKSVSQETVGGEHTRQEECHYFFSGLCLLVSSSWNFYSVANNGSISFPPSFRLPSILPRQEMVFAPPLGIPLWLCVPCIRDLSSLITCEVFCQDKSCDCATLVIDQWGTLSVSSRLLEALWHVMLYEWVIRCYMCG